MSWFSKKDKSRRNRRGNRKRVLRPQILQKREMFAADVIDIDVNSGVLEIEGTNQDDAVEVSINDRGNNNPLDDLIIVKATQEDGTVTDATFVKYNLGGLQVVNSIKFEGFNGDDSFKNRTGLDSDAHGGEGDDYFRGSSGRDKFFGDKGDDIMFGLSGDDELHGGRGEDVMFGGRGEDVMNGGRNNDRLYGGAHDDNMNGGSGNDYMSGWYGNDKMLGGSGNDTMRGGRGNDSVMGESGHDTMRGDQGDDFMFGGSGRDVINGNDGDDLLFGGDGKDTLHGGDDDDRLYGGDITGINMNQFNYGNPTFEKKSVAQDWDKDILIGGDGHDWFGQCDNGIFSDDVIHDRAIGEVVKDLDPFWATASTGQLNWRLEDYGHRKA